MSVNPTPNIEQTAPAWNRRCKDIKKSPFGNNANGDFFELFIFCF